MEYVSNWVTDKVAGYAKTGIQAGGSLAGNAVGGVGTLVENSGRSVGQSANGVSFDANSLTDPVSDFRYRRSNRRRRKLHQQLWPNGSELDGSGRSCKWWSTKEDGCEGNECEDPICRVEAGVRYLWSTESVAIDSDKSDAEVCSSNVTFTTSQVTTITKCENSS